LDSEGAGEVIWASLAISLFCRQREGIFLNPIEEQENGAKEATNHVGEKGIVAFGLFLGGRFGSLQGSL